MAITYVSNEAADNIQNPLTLHIAARPQAFRVLISCFKILVVDAARLQPLGVTRLSICQAIPRFFKAEQNDKSTPLMPATSAGEERRNVTADRSVKGAGVLR